MTDTSLLLLLIVPFGVFLIGLELFNRRKKREERQRETGDRQRRWFRLNTPLNRNAIPDYGRTVPPPPSRPRNGMNPRDARAEWQRQNGYNNIHNFKFFRSNVKNREQ